MEPLKRIGETPLTTTQASPRKVQTIRIRRFYVSDVSPLIGRIEETPSLHYGASPRRPVNYPDRDLGIEPRASAVFFTP